MVYTRTCTQYPCSQKLILLFEVTKEVDSEDVGLIEPVAITSLDSISSLLRGSKFNEEIPTFIYISKSETSDFHTHGGRNGGRVRERGRERERRKRGGKEGKEGVCEKEGDGKREREASTHPLKIPSSSTGYSCETICPNLPNTLLRTDLSFPMRSAPTLGALSTTMMES